MINSILSISGFFISAFIALFLFYRAAKNELIEEKVIFDISIFAAVGALVVGRLVDFVVNYEFYNFSFERFFFFNVYPSFDWYGGLLGAGLFATFYLKGKRQDNWQIFDLACAPIVFAAGFLSIVRFLIFNDFTFLYYTLGLLIIFWVLKRLEKQKRVKGFFISLTLVLVSVLNLILYPARNESYRIFGIFEYNLALPIITLIAGAVLFYVFLNRSVKSDFKNIFGAFLLLLFKTRRILTSVNEANLAAKAIITLPITLANLSLDLVKLLRKEIASSFYDLISTLGVKR